MSTLDRLHKAESAIAQLQSYSQALRNELAESKATAAHLGKLLMATVQTLVDSGALDQAKVFSSVMDLEDAQVKDHVTQALKLNAIVPVEAGGEKSLYILKQVKDGEVISNYFMAPYIELPEDIAADLVGKSVGYKFTYGPTESEIVEIYNQAE